MPFTKNMDATIAENMCRREFLTWLHVARYGIETRADAMNEQTKAAAWAKHATIETALAYFTKFVGLEDPVGLEVAHWAFKTISNGAMFVLWLEMDDPSFIWTDSWWIFKEVHRYKKEIAVKCGLLQAFL